MSENRIYDTLEFDDDINFDGLDDSEEEIDAEYDSEIDSQIESGDEPVSADTVDASEPDSVDETSVYEPPVVELPIKETQDVFENEVQDASELFKADNKSAKTERFLKTMCIVNAVVSVLTLSVIALGVYCGYKCIESVRSDLNEKNAEIAELEGKNSELEAEYLEAMNMFEKESEKETEIQLSEIEQGKIIHYDSYVGYSWMPVLSGIKRNTYKAENFSVDDRYRMSYNVDGEESSYFGIDVSSYQGDIDWQLVKEDGVEFAFLRIGYRGYGEEGKLCADEFFIQNYEEAHNAGIDLGIYFFSQAATVDEAKEEAEYVLSLLGNRQLEYPIVFDWETVVTGDPEDIPRTEDVMPQTLTLSAIAFCETIKDAGYDAMIYTNKKLATIKYDLRQLSEYPVWLAFYDTELSYCYDFDIWQYGTARVDGIEGEVDVNIAIIK